MAKKTGPLQLSGFRPRNSLTTVSQHNNSLTTSVGSRSGVGVFQAVVSVGHAPGPMPNRQLLRLLSHNTTEERETRYP